MKTLLKVKKSSTSKKKILCFSGAGNTFLLADNRCGDDPVDAETARRLCFEYAVDGLLLIEGSDKADFKMRILNRDGSEAEMCGNGSRAAAYWAHMKAGLGAKLMIETRAGLLEAVVKKRS